MFCLVVSIPACWVSILFRRWSPSGLRRTQGVLHKEASAFARESTATALDGFRDKGSESGDFNYDGRWNLCKKPFAGNVFLDVFGTSMIPASTWVHLWKCTVSPSKSRQTAGPTLKNRSVFGSSRPPPVHPQDMVMARSPTSTSINHAIFGESTSINPRGDLLPDDINTSHAMVKTWCMVL